MISNLHAQIQSANHQSPGMMQGIKEDFLRHMVLNSLRSYKTKFGNEYGEMVIACDNRNYWRKDIFPYYKARRKIVQDKSGLDWKTIFESLHRIKAEIKEFFPYRVIEVEKAEADDVIATLCSWKLITPGYDILIISADKDFVQLQASKATIKQYDPIRKRWIVNPDPVRYMKEHVLRGDVGDGIPNVLSGDTCFVGGGRQTPLRTKKLEELIDADPETLDERIKRNYNRNNQLINLSNVPEEIALDVCRQFQEQSGKKRDKLMSYFIKFRLKNLMPSIQEF
jgi:5'-3' exonuclease, N-terminal resolvase-like domain/T4 RNase H, C terminal